MDFRNQGTVFKKPFVFKLKKIRCWFPFLHSVYKIENRDLRFPKVSKSVSNMRNLYRSCANHPDVGGGLNIEGKSIFQN